MTAGAPPQTAPIVLVCGEDEFSVGRRARQLFQQWSEPPPAGEQEIIDATAANTGEALKAISRLREALQTLPFFGRVKVVWFQGCNFLGDDRTADSAAVSDALAGLAREWTAFRWDGVSLVISAGKVDRRKTFYKTLEKIGTVESLAGLSAEDRDWVDKAETLALAEFQALGKKVAPDALTEFVTRVGPNARALASEAEKLVLYAGAADRIGMADVEAVTSRNKLARAFALSDALGDRDLKKALRTLDEELWTMRTDRQRSEIGLLYGLISKVRTMLLTKELAREGHLRTDTDYGRFKAQWSALPGDLLPADRRFSPASINAYVAFKALKQSTNFQRQELVDAMAHLLDCNQRLVSSSLEGSLLLQQALVRILAGGRPATKTA